MPQSEDEAIDELIQRFASDQQMRLALNQQHPALAEALQAKDKGEHSEHLTNNARHLARVKKIMQDFEAARRAHREQQHRMYTADPFDAEAQRAIEEHIRYSETTAFIFVVCRKENIEASLEHAMEHMPE